MFTYSAFSFGGGTQSTALLLLIKNDPDLLLKAIGHLPDKAYFADTGAEPQHVYQHIEQMQSEFTIPFEIVSNGSLLSSEIKDGIQPRTFPPYFTKNWDGTTGMLLRKCTSEFKIRPIEKAIRRDISLAPGRCGISRSISLWLGISIDEIQRVRDNRTKLFSNIYPLIELGWNRSRCFEYCRSFGIAPPKSRCFFCPYIADWLEIKRNHPQEFAKAVIFDREIRNTSKKGLENPIYLHKSCQPLDEAIANQGHLWEGYPDEFSNECSGHCGL